MPVYDFVCESCGWEFEDIYVQSADHEPLFCRDQKKEIVRIDFVDEIDEETGEEYGEEVEIVTEESGCASEVPLVRMIGAPSPPVLRVGKHGSAESKREEAVEKRKKLLKRSKDHEFKRGSKGSEERRAHLDKLKKNKVPIAGKFGF